jgi:hypothetical protein
MKTFLFDKTRWVYANVLTNVICMGLLHAPIAHGLGGAHGKELTLLQVATHTLSLWFFLSVLIVAQNKAWKRSVNLVTAPNLVALLGLVPLMFWAGYYTLYIPFDILFMYLTLGAVNGWTLKPYVKRPALWMVQMVLTDLSAAVAGIAAGFSCFAIYSKNIHGMPFDIALWTTITLPAGFAYAFVGRHFIRRHFETTTAEAIPTPELEVSYQ